MNRQVAMICVIIFLAAMNAAVRSACGQSLDLSGQWRWRAELHHPRGDKGDASKGWHQPDFDDSDWELLNVGMPWETQGKAYDGIAWYRRSFVIPESWRGRPLILQLGSPDDGAEVYFNGRSIGTWKFSQDIRCDLPADAVRWGGKNMLAVRVWDWYKNGGLGGTHFSIQYIAPFAQAAAPDPAGAKPLALNVTTDLPDDPLSSLRWESGWRDGGLSDTRPKLSVARGVFHGGDAIAFNVWYPNSTEFIDYVLPPDQTGDQWAAHQADYIAFWYRTDDLRGHMTLQFTKVKHQWGRRAPVWQTSFPVKPGAWTRIVLPLSAFTSGGNGGSDQVDRLVSPAGLRYLVMGYVNHQLQGPGTIQFAGFEVGSTRAVDPFFQPLSLAGLWKFQLDNLRPDGSKSEIARRDPGHDLSDDDRGYGVKLGYQRVDLDDSKWPVMSIGDSWFSQGFIYRGPAWYRQQVIVPDAWIGRPLTLRLGTARDAAEVYWNGQLVGRTQDKESVAVTIPAEQVRAGEPNQIAVKVTAWTRMAGLVDGPFTIAPADHAQLLLADPDHPDSAVTPGSFEMGVQPPKNIDVVLRWASDAKQVSKLTAHYRLVDCFHRPIVAGDLPLERDGDRWRAVIHLDGLQTRQLYYGEWFDAVVTVTDGEGQVVAVHAFPDGDQANMKMRYDRRDALALPALAETVDDTPYGKLKLVDVIDCAADPDTDPHPYKEGGIRNSWVGLRAYATWKDGITIQSLGNRKYREADNNQFFAYRVGRGKLQPHKAYLLRVLVPDDKSRYQVMEIKAGRNYQGTGYRSGIGPDDPVANYPKTHTYQWYDHIVVNDETTYGYRGDRTVSSENGIWVVFHDIGRAYAAAYEAGPAAAEIRLYEMPDGADAEPVIRYPADQPRRVLMMDWERQPETPPADAVRYAQLMGMNGISPVIQKWASAGFWHSDIGFEPPGWYKVAPEGVDDRDVYQAWLDATRRAKINFIPRIEYGGGPNLPTEARVIGPNGKVDPCGRFCTWGANILHPATWEEMKSLIDELIGRHIHDNPQLAGLLWRQRQDRIKCSYGRADIELFCEETGATMPGGDDAHIAKWAFGNPDYAQWWQGKRAQFLRRVRDYLKTFRSDLVLYYYNWDPDGWSPGLTKNEVNTPADWSDYYNVDRAHLYAERIAAARRKLTDQFYVDYLQRSRQPHRNIDPSLFADDKDIVIFAPVQWRYLADNGPYIRYFLTGDGLAISDLIPYEEKGRWNLQGDRYETSELTPGGRDFAMAEEVMAFYHGDCNVMTTTTYTYGRGWADAYRRFAQAFLALPDLRGQIVADAVAPAENDVRVRRYDTPAGVYLSVVSKAMSARQVTVRVNIQRDHAKVIDLVTGQPIESTRDGDAIVFKVSLDAMQLNSYLVQ